MILVSVKVVYGFSSLAVVPTPPAVQASARVNNMFKQANVGEAHASVLMLGSHDGAWY